LLQKSQTDSLACLHAVEHFGLGRYGDPIDINGWHTGLKNMAMMLSPGGVLYLSVPVGRQSIEFNAHRVFDPETIVSAGREFGMKLVDFSLVDDRGDFHESCDTSSARNLRFGCGCFVFESACT
jgi:Caenorhabditis protein of unknown function, DUF268